MRKTILMMLLAAVSSSAAAEWVEVGSDEAATVYADPATIRKEGGMATMWSLFDYKAVRVPDKPFEPYLSMRGQSEYDCKKQQARGLSASYHPGNMAKGDLTIVVYSNPATGNWKPVPPGSLIETLWKFACGK
jgi:hypothetical protein